MWSTISVWIFWLLFPVPLVVCAFVSRAFWWSFVLGLVLAAVEWRLAYRDNQVEHGGDWNAGAELAGATGFWALVLFGLWVALAIAGVALRRVFARGRTHAFWNST
jgi:hypothetical protein